MGKGKETSEGLGKGKRGSEGGCERRNEDRATKQSQTTPQLFIIFVCAWRVSFGRETKRTIDEAPERRPQTKPKHGTADRRPHPKGEPEADPKRTDTFNLLSRSWWGSDLAYRFVSKTQLNFITCAWVCHYDTHPSDHCSLFKKIRKKDLLWLKKLKKKVLPGLETMLQ